MNEAERSERVPFPRWKKIAIGGAAALVLAGIGLRLIPSGGDETSGEERGRSALISNPGSTPPGTEEMIPLPPPEEAPPGLSRRLSPFLLHGGLSFFVGLAIGAAVRAILKGVLVVAGTAFLVLFVLSYSGLIRPIDWKEVEEWFSVHMEEAGPSTEGLREHILLHLPSAGLAGAGLVTGLKRK